MIAGSVALLFFTLAVVFAAFGSVEWLAQRVEARQERR